MTEHVISRTHNRSTMNDDIKVTSLFDAGMSRSVAMGIDAQHASAIIDEMTDLSSNKGAYTAREAFSNAYDATKATGDMTRPIEIEITSWCGNTGAYRLGLADGFYTSNEFNEGIASRILRATSDVYEDELAGIISITDHGVGMCAGDGSIDAFYQYGGSSKTGRMSIGSKGLGAKAPLAVSDWFDVETAKNGVRTRMHLYRSGGANYCDIVDAGSCPSDESGTTVIIPFSNEYDFDNAVECLSNICLFCPDASITVNGVEFKSHIDGCYTDLGQVRIGVDENGDDIATRIMVKSFPRDIMFVGNSAIALNVGGYLYNIGDSRKGHGNSWNGVVMPQIIVDNVSGAVNFTISRDEVKDDAALSDFRSAVVDALESGDFSYVLRDRLGACKKAYDGFRLLRDMIGKPRWDSSTGHLVDDGGAVISMFAGITTDDLTCCGVSLTDALSSDSNVHGGSNAIGYVRSGLESSSNRKFYCITSCTDPDKVLNGINRNRIVSLIDTDLIYRFRIEDFSHVAERHGSVLVVENTKTTEMAHRIVMSDSVIDAAFGFDARYDRSVVIYDHAVSDNAIDRAIIDGLGATVVSYDEFERKIKDARASKRPVRLTPSQKCLDGMRSAIYDLTAVCGVNDDDKWCVNDAIDAIDASSVMSLADGIRAINRAMDERDHGRVFDAMEAKGACLDDVDGSYAVIYQYGIKTRDLHMFAAARALGYIDPSVTRIAFINSSEFKVQTMRKVAKRASVILCGDGSERCVFDAMTRAGIKPENRSGYAIAISTDVTSADGRKLDTGADAGALRRINALRAVKGRYYSNPYSGSYYSSARGGSLAKDILDAVEAGVIDVPSSVKDAVESVIDVDVTSACELERKIGFGVTTDGVIVNMSSDDIDDAYAGSIDTFLGAISSSAIDDIMRALVRDRNTGNLNSPVAPLNVQYVESVIKLAASLAFGDDGDTSDAKSEDAESRDGACVDGDSVTVETIFDVATHRNPVAPERSIARLAA